MLSSERPTFLRMLTAHDIPYFASPSCAELIIDGLVGAQRREWFRLHAFIVLPTAVEIIATSVQQDIMGFKEHFQAQTAIFLKALLPEDATPWDRRFVVKWLDSQRALDLQLDAMRASAAACALEHDPARYPFAWTHPRFKGVVVPYKGFNHFRVLLSRPHMLPTKPHQRAGHQPLRGGAYGN